jgi:hypothetical protein
MIPQRESSFKKEKNLRRNEKKSPSFLFEIQKGCITAPCLILISGGENRLPFCDPETGKVLIQKEVRSLLRKRFKNIAFASTATPKVSYFLFPDGELNPSRVNVYQTPALRLKDFWKLMTKRNSISSDHSTRMPPNVTPCDIKEQKLQFLSPEVQTLLNTIVGHYDFILAETVKNRAEVGGNITLDGKFRYRGPNPDKTNPFLIEPEKEKCLATWHSHPSGNVLYKPKENILFNFPSLGDIYYSFIGRLLDLYPVSFVGTWEGI